jgi:hypothetical protein
MSSEVVGKTSIIQYQKPTRILSKSVNPSWTALIGILVGAIYFTLLPIIERTWRPTGDEPHYLLASHSLTTDLDFDLANNYDEQDYLAFHTSRDITRQIRTNAAGQQILNHYPGLPILIAPAYALGGRFGVLVFQTILGSLLAVITFKLAFVISRDEKASLLATLFVALSPPLLLYHFLIYPELIGALLTTLILYYAVSLNRPSRAVAILVVLSLITLPWFNRRFAPFAFLMALLIIWAWRKENSLKGLLSRAGIVGGVATGLSIAVLMWFNSQLDPPSQADFTFSVTMLWHRLFRGIGWLLDQQRGLFIFAPIYIVALWGLPPLLANSLRYRNRHWFVVLPFLLSLGVTAAAGGFWIAWEVGPRFLVVALPALAPLLALVWRHYSRWKVLSGSVILLFGFSLSNSLVIIQNPELPYKSSLPLFYSQALGLGFTELLPDLAGYATISVTDANPETKTVATHDNEMVSFAEAGSSSTLVQPIPLPELPYGHYNLTWTLGANSNLSPETKLVRLTVKILGGGQLFNKIITAADLPGDGNYGKFRYSFLNPTIDRWGRSMVLHAVSTGQSNIRAKEIILTPDLIYAWILPYLYLTFVTGGAFLMWHRIRQSSNLQTESQLIRLFSVPNEVSWGLLLILSFVTLGNLLYQENQIHRTYPANKLYHFVGQPIADLETENGQTWLVDPSIDPPQKAIYGPFDIYDPSLYNVTFRVKLPEPTETEQDIARLQVSATTNFDELETQTIRHEHFSKADLYHDFVLTINNPRRQALSFEVHYLGVAALAIDKITITKIED